MTRANNGCCMLKLVAVFLLSPLFLVLAVAMGALGLPDGHTDGR